jgi:hypothetical protein
MEWEVNKCEAMAAVLLGKIVNVVDDENDKWMCMMHGDNTLCVYRKGEDGQETHEVYDDSWESTCLGELGDFFDSCKKFCIEDDA